MKLLKILSLVLLLFAALLGISGKSKMVDLNKQTAEQLLKDCGLEGQLNFISFIY